MYKGTVQSVIVLENLMFLNRGLKVVAQVHRGLLLLNKRKVMNLYLCLAEMCNT